MKKQSRYPDYAGYWFIEMQHGKLLVCRVDSATWLEQLGDLQLVEQPVFLMECTVGGRAHVALSLTVEGSYGPGKPTWIAHIRRHPKWRITSRKDWFSEKAMEIANGH